MKRIFTIFLLITLLYSCDTGIKSKLAIKLSDAEPKSMNIGQYGKALFEADTNQFQQALLGMQADFRPFLQADLYDSANLKQLRDFVGDTFLISLYHLTQEVYPDVKQLEQTLLPVLQHFNYYFPAITPPPVYTYISGVSPQAPIIAGADAIAIGLDCYLGDSTLAYKQLQIPKYMTLQMTPAFLPRDFALALYAAYLEPSDNAKTILDEMIKSGKKLFVVEALNPSMTDDVLLGYSEKQMDWVNENEGKIWAFLVGEQLLYSNDFMMFKKLFGPGPFTKEFGEDAPPRLGEYIGLQIIRQFVNHQTHIDLPGLLIEKDAQEILTKARYKPAK